MESSSIVYSKGFMKMEEQTVPSAGFSPPQSSPYESNYIPKFQHSQNYGPMMTSLDDPAPYGNLADTFDLSLLGDTYDDHDMATVPSPGSWIPSASLEAPCWQQISLYASSPLGSDCYGAFSPDSKPSLLSAGPASPAHSAYDGNTGSMCQSPQTPAMSPMSTAESDRNLLLRQCLEDMSFQRKYNFKPMDLPNASLLESDLLAMREIIGSNNGTGGGTNSVGSNLELNQIEPVFSLAFEQIQSDIQNTCSILAISPDPMQWSSTDVQCWLAHTLSSLPGMMTMSGGSEAGTGSGLVNQFWNMDGLSLYSLTEEEFRRCDPVNGDRVFAQLELWKMFQGKGYAVKTEEVTGVSNGGNDMYMEQLLMSSPDLSPLPSLNSPASHHDLTVPALHLPGEEQDMKLFSSASSDSSCSSSVEAHSPLSVHSLPEPMASDDEDEEEEAVEKKPVVVKGTKGTGTPGTNKSGAHIHLWQFLKELLASPQQNGACIRWLDQSRGVFKIEESVRVARLWGLRKNRPAMNYDKLSRSIRQYYRKGIMRKTERSQRLVYQFCHPYGL